MTATKFDPTDKKYQVSEEYPPNKTSEWKHPPEKDGWVLAHNSLRSEIGAMIQVMENANTRAMKEPLQLWEIECMKEFWSSHWIHIHGHHRNEDAVFVPFLQTRYKYPEKCASDHKELEVVMDKLDGMIKTLKVVEGKNEDDGLFKKHLHDIVKLMKEYQDLSLQHFQEEEETCLPLMRAYFVPSEIAEKVQEILSNGPKVEMGSFISAMGVDYFRNTFMVQEGIPGFVWHIQFKGQVREFEQKFKTPVEAVQTGIKPIPSSSCCTIL